jgi:hypothetical protein
MSEPSITTPFFGSLYRIYWINTNCHRTTQLYKRARDGAVNATSVHELNVLKMVIPGVMMFI